MDRRRELVELIQRLRDTEAAAAGTLAWRLEGIALSPHVSDATIEALCEETAALLRLVGEQRRGLY